MRDKTARRLVNEQEQIAKAYALDRNLWLQGLVGDLIDAACNLANYHDIDLAALSAIGKLTPTGKVVVQLCTPDTVNQDEEAAAALARA
jgi:hypothetical protein